MIGLRGGHERPGLDPEQPVLAHDPRHALVVHHHPPPAEFRRDPAVTIASPMFEGNLLDRRPHFHVFFQRHLLFE